MPFYRINDSMVHLNLGGKARKHPPPACRARVEPWSDHGITRNLCCGIGVALCDFPMPVQGDESATCSMPLCAEHATEVGPDLHRCPGHKPT